MNFVLILLFWNLIEIEGFSFVLKKKQGFLGLVCTDQKSQKVQQVEKVMPGKIDINFTKNGVQQKVASSKHFASTKLYLSLLLL